MKERKESLKSTIYGKIYDGIIKGEFKAGDILTENELTALYGCSKTPIREALVELCSQHIMKNIPRYGYEVVRLSAFDIKIILDYRLILEGGNLDLVVKSLNPDKIAKLKELDSICQENRKDMWSHWESNVNFHLYLMELGQNPYSFNQLKIAMNILKRGYAQFYWDKWRSDFTPSDLWYHSFLIEALEESGDAREVKKALALDLKDFPGMDGI